MAVPQNCKECAYASICKSWYGGTQCKHKDQIINKEAPPK